MRFGLFRRRNVVLPTLLGWTLLAAIGGALLLTWWFGAETFLSLTERLPAQVLVVEAWTDTAGADAAAAEFKRFGSDYQYIVVAGGLTGDPWSKRRWSFPEIAERELIRSGIPGERIIAVRSGSTGNQRTYSAAVEVRKALSAREIHPAMINVFTRGVHARRSRLVFAKVFRHLSTVGVVCWIPPGYENGPWWKSSERAIDLLKETVGYSFEMLFNSGRLPFGVLFSANEAQSIPTGQSAPFHKS